MNDEFTHRGPGTQADILGLDPDAASVEAHQRLQSIDHRPAEAVDAGHHKNGTLAPIVDGSGQSGPIRCDPTGGVPKDRLTHIGLQGLALSGQVLLMRLREDAGVADLYRVYVCMLSRRVPDISGDRPSSAARPAATRFRVDQARRKRALLPHEG